jgi:hypothetical protein
MTEAKVDGIGERDRLQFAPQARWAPRIARQTFSGVAGISIWQTRQNPRTFPHGGRETPLASIDPASTTKSYTNPNAYVVPASPLMRPNEFFRLGAGTQ